MRLNHHHHHNHPPDKNFEGNYWLTAFSESNHASSFLISSVFVCSRFIFVVVRFSVAKHHKPTTHNQPTKAASAWKFSF